MTAKKKQPPVAAKKISPKSEKPFLLRFASLLLIVSVLIVYAHTIPYGFTELDDSIFIKETKEYNSDWGNLLTSFRRGVFNETNDSYFRPLLLDSFIINYQLSEENIKSWRVINILLHLVSVVLLFYLLKKIGLNETSSLLLSLLFAVHPVLSQAVVWIPGRNDTMLAVFVFSFLIAAISYSNNGKISSLILQWLALMAALFTKETAVFAAPAAFVIIIFLHRKKLLESRSIVLFVSWAVAGGAWFYVRSQATLNNDQLDASEILKTFPHRLPVLIQYLGKIFLPLNLSVFPTEHDTTYVYGIISVVILAAIIFLARPLNWREILTGFAIYFLLFIPALMVPASLNDQDFEHRTYLPMLGILIVLSETVLLKNKLKLSTQIAAGIGVCVVLAILNFSHQKNFTDPVTFWGAAVKTSPNSAYANMMLGARLDDIDKKRGEELIRKAYSINPDEKYINYYMGVMMQDHDSILASEKYFLKEIEISDYFQCYFHLARVAFEKQDKPAAINYLETYLDRNSSDSQANNNLLLLYVETNQLEQARTQAERMRQFGIPVPAEIEARLK